MNPKDYSRLSYNGLKPKDLNKNLIVTSRTVSRYVKSEYREQLNFDFQYALAPSESLHNDFEEAKKSFIKNGVSPKIAHYRAFYKVNYIERYFSEQDRTSVIKQLKELNGDIIFLCHCAADIPCHTKLLVKVIAQGFI